MIDPETTALGSRKPAFGGDSLLLRGQLAVLELVASGAPLGETLAALIALVEAREPGLRGGIATALEDGARFAESHGAGLPPHYHAVVAGRPLAPPYCGACGEAAHLGRPVMLPDLAADTRYAPEWRDLLLGEGVAALRSTPIVGTNGQVLGSFAFYYPTPRDPNPADPALTEAATHLAAIAIERAREHGQARQREARLAEGAAQFASMVENAPFGTYAIDADFRITLASQIARRAFGIDALVGMDLAEALRRIWPEPFASHAIEQFRHTLATGEPYVSTDTVEQRADRDTTEAYEWRTERVRLPAGGFGVVCYFYDLTERQQMQAALRESEARYRLTVNGARDYAIVTLDAAGTIVGWNAGAERMMGYCEAEALGQPGAIFFTAEDRQSGHVEREMRLALNEGRAENERWHVRRDGSRFWGSGLMMPLPEPQAGYVKIFRDRTAEHEAESRLAQLANELRQTLDTTATGIIRCSRDLRYLAVNPAYARLVGRQEAEIVGRPILDIVGPSVFRTIRPHIEKVLGGERVEYEAELAYPGRPPQWLHAIYAPHRDAAGEIAGWVASITDITERKRAEAALAASEAFRRQVTDVAPSILYLYDLHQERNIWGNRAMAAALGCTPEQLARPSASPMQERMHPEDLPAYADHLRRVLALPDGATAECEYRFRRPGGDWGWLHSRDRVFRRDAAGRPEQIVGAALDVTVQKQAKAVLAHDKAELERRVAEVVAERDSTWRLARDMVVVVDAAGVFLSVNPAVTEILGWAESEMRGRSGFDFIHPDDIEASVGALQHAKAGVLPRFENRYRRRDGGWRTISWIAAPESGRVYGFGRDVTAEREAARQLAEAQAQLAHSRRMEALGQLAGGIAHDFNNVLQAVQGGAGLMERRPEDPMAVRRLARMVGEAASRGAAVTRRLLAFSRRADLRAEAVDPVALLTELREVLTHTLGAGIGVRVAAAPGTPALLADKAQLETVLVNLATNARDAMSGQGTLTLAATIDVLPKSTPPLPPMRLAAGSYLRLSVSDTGSGMGPDVLARVMEPFFTTKPQGQGTGLGLAMARGFAEQSGGGLAIESEPGRGSTVRLWLPLAGAAASGEAAAAPSPARPRDARVLVVDDEPLVREIVAETLERAGYAVRALGDAAQALDWLDGGEGVDLIVSDLAMPGMDGVAFVREANRRRSNLPAILLTGYATNAAELAVGGAIGGTFSLLRKPVSERELIERVAMLLGGAAAAEPEI